MISTYFFAVYRIKRDFEFKYIYIYIYHAKNVLCTLFIFYFFSVFADISPLL